MSIPRFRGLIAVSVFLLLAAVANADEPVTNGTQPVTDTVRRIYFDQRPAPVPLPVSVPQPELTLEVVLENWHRANSKIKRLDLEFDSTHYNAAFGVVERGTGLVSFDSSGRGMFKIGPVAMPKNPDTIQQAGGSGHLNKYQVLPATPVRWHWTGTHVFKVNDRDREYESAAIPPEDRRPKFRPSRPEPPPLPVEVRRKKNLQPVNPIPVTEQATKSAEPEQTQKRSPSLIEAVSTVLLVAVVQAAFKDAEDTGWSRRLRMAFCKCWLPQEFLLGIPLEELQQKYTISLAKQSPTEIRLEFVAKQKDPQFKQIYLLLSREDFRPKALKLFESYGEKSIVFVFKNLRVDALPSAPFGDLGSPDLRGYRRMTLSDED